nr:MAG TPA: hypothetical protein [Caudoviricetes sp.]
MSARVSLAICSCCCCMIASFAKRSALSSSRCGISLSTPSGVKGKPSPVVSHSSDSSGNTPLITSISYTSRSLH